MSNVELGVGSRVWRCRVLWVKRGGLSVECKV